MSNWSRPAQAEAFKLSEESARAAVFQLLDFYRVNPDEIAGTQERNAFDSCLNKLSAAYRRGQLENKLEAGSLSITQHLVKAPGDVKDITYAELKGAHKIAMDGYKAEAMTARQHALLGAMSGLGSDAIAALKAVDLSVAEDLAYIFFMA